MMGLQYRYGIRNDRQPDLAKPHFSTRLINRIDLTDQHIHLRIRKIFKGAHRAERIDRRLKEKLLTAIRYRDILIVIYSPEQSIIEIRFKLLYRRKPGNIPAIGFYIGIDLLTKKIT